jgi:hypothetical protein
MRSPPPPIRFLLAAVAGWAALRVAILVPPWSGNTRARQAAVARVDPSPVATLFDTKLAEPAQLSPLGSSRERSRGASSAVEHVPAGTPAVVDKRLPPAPRAVARASISLGTNELVALAPNPTAPAIATVPTSLTTPIAPHDARLSVSGWLFVRRGSGERGIAPGGTLGGSQAGARATYRLSERLSMSLRLYAPLNDRSAAEAALGLDWKPLGGLPLRLLVERRAGLGRDGRSAFGLTVYGGVDRKAGRFRLDAYGQAGLVGARRRDLFADAAARLTVPLGRFRLGAGAWAAAQPGVARLDAGPHAEFSLREGSLTLAADWRFRLAGAARPGPGPAITLSTGF